MHESPLRASLLFYVDEEMNGCVEHYQALKQRHPFVDACFIFSRKFRSPYKRWLNKLPYVHLFVKGRKNSTGVKLQSPLEVHRDAARKGQFSAFFAVQQPLTMIFRGTLAGIPCQVAMDTAATHTFVDKAIASRIVRRISQTDVLDIELGDGRMTNTEGTINAKLNIQA
jgi:Retroviral aspartyl protease